jgi:hypothetical protein
MRQHAYRYFSAPLDSTRIDEHHSPPLDRARQTWIERECSKSGLT